jgi:hypothetical protein
LKPSDKWTGDTTVINTSRKASDRETAATRNDVLTANHNPSTT